MLQDDVADGSCHHQDLGNSNVIRSAAGGSVSHKGGLMQDAIVNRQGETARKS